MTMDWNHLFSPHRCAKSHNGPEIRSLFQKDYDRIIFSSAFRRMQDKTQVFPLPGPRMVHNRLTHSLEVASVGRSIARMSGTKLQAVVNDPTMLYNMEVVVSTACLAHDLGNPPFGHSGEDTISGFFSNGPGRCYQDAMLPEQWSDLISFEGNANAFRLLTHQYRGRRKGGFSLTAATLGTLVKYPCASYLRGGLKKYNVFYSEIDDFKRVMELCGIPRLDKQGLIYARHPLSYMMEAADDICYLILDMEDAHKRHILSSSEVEQVFMSFFDESRNADTYEYKHKIFKEVTDVNERMAFLRALLINHLVNHVSDVFKIHYQDIMDGTFKGSLISYLPQHENDALRKARMLSVEKIYNDPSVVKIELAGYKVIGTLLEEFTDAVIKHSSSYHKKLMSLIPEQFLPHDDSVYSRIQCVLDFLSNMTDLYAVRLYKDLRGID